MVVERRSFDSPTANAARHFCQDMCVRNRTNFPAIPPTSQLSKQLIGLASFSAEARARRAAIVDPSEQGTFPTLHVFAGTVAFPQGARGNAWRPVKASA